MICKLRKARLQLHRARGTSVLRQWRSAALHRTRRC
jgi:hypothetical protein